MSANNWTACPKCKQLTEKVASSYGKISEEEYLATLSKHVEKYKEVESDLREDYEIGVDSLGKFSVWYSGSCWKCDFKFEYTYSQELI